MSEKQEVQIQVGVRLAESMLERLDKLAERMSEPGKRFTRAEVLRMAVFRGVEKIEAETRKR